MQSFQALLNCFFQVEGRLRKIALKPLESQNRAPCRAALDYVAAARGGGYLCFGLSVNTTTAPPEPARASFTLLRLLTLWCVLVTLEMVLPSCQISAL